MGMKKRGAQETINTDEMSTSEARAHFISNKSDLGRAERALVSKLLAESDLPLKNVLRDPDRPIRLLARALQGAGSGQTRKEMELSISRQTVVEDSLEVTGELLITNHVLVLGDVRAKQISIDEGGSLAVAGNVEARSVYCGGFLHVTGDLQSRLLVGFDGGVAHCNRILTELTLMHMYCSVDANEHPGPKFIIDQVELDDAEYLQIEEKIHSSCLSEEEADFGVGRIDFRLLIKAAQKGAAFLR